MIMLDVARRRDFGTIARLYRTTVPPRPSGPTAAAIAPMKAANFPRGPAISAVINCL
jgi:hypothetical protein